jgi:hypothetical protein
MGRIKKVNMKGNEIPFTRFKLRHMVKDPAIVMIAKRGSGKSWLVRTILRFLCEKRNVPGGMIICKTEKMNPFYGKFFPDLFIHYEYSTEILNNLLNRQQQILKKRVLKKAQGKKINARALLVMDDCLADKKSWVKDKPIGEIFYNGRHYKLTYILTMQYPLGIGPELRNNFDYIFLLSNNFVSIQKKIYDHYAGMFDDFSAFRQVFNQLTENFGAMVIVNNSKSKTVCDQVFHFKADEDEGKDMIGGKQFKKTHHKYYDKKWDNYKDKKTDFNELALRAKKNKVPIKITLKD